MIENNFIVNYTDDTNILIANGDCHEMETR